MPLPIHIIGGGLAGSEAAWQIAEAGLPAVLHEMRPVRPTPAHQTDRLAELVCSNSLKSESGRLRALAAQGGIAPARIRCCCAPPQTLAFPAAMRSRWTAKSSPRKSPRAIEAHPRIEMRREEVRDIHRAGRITIIATGPLTSDALAEEIARLTGAEPPVLLRQHQPHRRRRIGRSHHRLPRFALRQIDRRHGRLSQLPVRPRAVRSASSTRCWPPKRCPAHIAEDRTPLLRSLPAHRRAGPPRPRHAALRPHEADGADRSAHRPASLGRGAASPGKSARR